MIEVELHGRFGNHLFQYAFAYTVAKELNTNFKFRYTYRTNIHEYLETPSYNKPFHIFSSRFSKFYEKYHDKILNYKRNIKKVDESEIDVFQPIDNTTYKGFYQSDKFFKKYESDIRKEFKFKNKYIKQFESKFGELYSNHTILAVHIRRGDYLEVDLDDYGSNGLQLPISYYKNNIKKIATKDTKVLFLSDDIEYVKQEFDDNENYFFSESSLILDFIAISKADKVIISNSSFSWWAAYLNEKTDVHIIGPKYHLGFKVNKEMPEGIMYENFEWVEVFEK